MAASSRPNVNRRQAWKRLSYGTEKNPMIEAAVLEWNRRDGILVTEATRSFGPDSCEVCRASYPCGPACGRGARWLRRPVYAVGFRRWLDDYGRTSRKHTDLPSASKDCAR
jgi:hypothetical protein